MYFFCCSRLDYTTCYSCRFNYTEFPWAIQILWWCKWEEKPVLLFVYCQHTPRPSEALSSCICLCCSPPPPLVGAVTCHGNSVLKIKARCYTSPPVQPLPRACGAPKIQKSWSHGSGAVFMSTHVLGVVSVADTTALRREPLLCCTAPGGFA